MSEAWILLALLGLFIGLTLPSLGDLAKYHGDERFYTDAAIRMLETGAYATPTYPDGQPRFNKPLLTYWTVAASFRAFGIGVVASRLPFVVAGCLLTVLTWRLGCDLLDDRGAALLAAAIVVANPQLAVLATRATPDILLVLFVALSFAGFAHLIVHGARRPAAYAAAWIGAGLAVATKGAPGLVAVAYCVAFVAVRRDPRLPLRALVDARALLVGAAVAAAGLVTPYLRHGRRALDVLYFDQIGARPVAGSIAAVVGNVGSYLVGTAVELLPWSALLALVLAYDRGLLRRVPRPRVLYAFGIGWWIALVAVFATHDFMRLRYVAPAYPMLALVAAALFAAAARRREDDRLLRTAVRALLAALAVLGTVLALAGAAVDRRLVLAGALWIATASAWRWVRRARGVAPLVALAGATMVAITTADSLVRPVFDASPARALSACLGTLASPDARPATVGLAPNLASKIRLASGGRLDLATLPDDPDPATLAAHGVLVIPPPLAARWRHRGYHLAPCGFEYAHWTARDVWEVATRRDRERVFERHRRYYFVGVPGRRDGVGGSTLVSPFPST